MNRRNLLKLLVSLPFVGKGFKSVLKKEDPWADPIGTIVRNPSNITWPEYKLGDIEENRAGHKWVRKFGTIPYPKGSPYHGTCDYYWERVS